MKKITVRFEETSADMTKQHKGFIVFNSKTKKSTKYPYIKGKNSVDVENMSIKEQMELTGQPRPNFSVTGFY